MITRDANKKREQMTMFSIDDMMPKDYILRKIDCPLMDEKIIDTICFDIHMVVEGLAPEYTAPSKVTQIPGYKEICLKCPNHRAD